MQSDLPAATLRMVVLPCNFLKRNGGGGIRTPEPLLGAAGFQDRCLQPLGHPSDTNTSNSVSTPASPRSNTWRRKNSSRSAGSRLRGGVGADRGASQLLCSGGGGTVEDRPLSLWPLARQGVRYRQQAGRGAGRPATQALGSWDRSLARQISVDKGVASQLGRQLN